MQQLHEVIPADSEACIRLLKGNNFEQTLSLCENIKMCSQPTHDIN